MRPRSWQAESNARGFGWAGPSRATLLVAGVLSLGAYLSAQGRPNFTGQWTLLERPEAGPGSGSGTGGGRGGAAGSFCGQTCTIKHDSAEIVVERIPGGASVTAKYKLNGDESRIARDLVARASWVEGNIVIISHHARDPGVTRTLTVAMAGDTMIVEGSTEGGLATQAASALTYRRGPPSPGAAITRPTLVREEKPQYTNEARRAEIQGIVAVEAVVLEDGTVGEVRILKSLDKVFGLDTQALAAAKKFRFRPALDNGKPVRFKVVIQLEFRLHRPEAS